MKYDNSKITVSAKKHAGDRVPYGSTTAQLPDEIEINWKGNIRIDFSLDEVMDLEEPLTGVDYDAAVRDFVLEAMSDNPESFEYGGSRRSDPEEGKMHFTDFTIIAQGTNLVVNEGDPTHFVIVDPIDYEWK